MSDPVAEAAAAAGVRVTKDAPGGTPWRPRALYANPRLLSSRWPYACMRINRICEGAKPVRTSGGHVSYHESVRTAQCPGLALRYLETYFYLMTRHRPPPAVGADHSPFRYMTDRDALAKFVAIVEDICDQSTGKLGGWYVGVSETGFAGNRG